MDETRSPGALSPGGPILLVAPEPFYEDRGTPIAVRQVAQALCELGREVHILTFPVGETVELPGLTIHRIANPFAIRRVPIGFSLRKLVLDVGLVLALVRLLRTHDYQVVHAVEEAVFPTIVLARRRRIPVVYDMQSHLPQSMSKSAFCRIRPMPAFLERFQRWAVRNAAAVACSAGLEGYVGSVREIGPIHPWRYPSYDIRPAAEETDRLRRSLEIDPDRPVVLYTGNFEPYQGLARLVEAAPQVLDEIPGAYFLFVGGGDGGELAALPGAERLVRAGALRCLPRQPRQSIPGFLALADVVVSPREAVANLPLKVFDYMAAGKAIVATDSPSHRAYLDDDRALLVAPDGAALARGIVRLLRNRAEAERIGERAREYAVEHLGWLGFRGHLAAFYEATLANASCHGDR